MTDTGNSDLASLEPLEPLDGAMQSAPVDDPMAQQRSGLAAPAYNLLCRDKTFYRFLFAGVVMFVGTLLPYDASDRPYVMTMSGAFTMLLAIAMIWTWWGAIANGRSSNASLKWLLFCSLPLVAGIWTMVAFDPAAALFAAQAKSEIASPAMVSEGWKALLGDMFGGAFKRNPEMLLKAETFWRMFGVGNFVVMFGALLAELGFLGGFVGGFNQNKQAAKAKQAAAAERRRK